MPDIEPTLAAAGFLSFRGRVRPDWIDGHAHMNVLAYDELFQIAESAFFLRHGVGADYPATGRGYFRLEKHLRHLAELREGEAVAVTTYLVFTDPRRIRMFHQLWNLASGARTATMEGLSIHVDLALRRAAPQTDPAIAAAWRATAAAHARLPVPEGVGRAISHEGRKG
ncbi:MAG: thioesterase [Rhodovulum sulfidophilum]|uniref:Thioesterase n=1 Tax=Rhodovulum sulfidophilum TaxID=35806 RepID=A0A2W5N6P9_RHOSU|nr:MAG: thioesterase [Rhodovulum sulfidophilum]